MQVDIRIQAEEFSQGLGTPPPWAVESIRADVADWMAREYPDVELTFGAERPPISAEIDAVQVRVSNEVFPRWAVNSWPDYTAGVVTISDYDGPCEFEGDSITVPLVTWRWLKQQINPDQLTDLEPEDIVLAAMPWLSDIETELGRVGRSLSDVAQSVHAYAFEPGDDPVWVIQLVSGRN